MNLIDKISRYIRPEDLVIAGVIALYAFLCYVLAASFGYGHSYTPLMYGSAQVTFSSGLLVLYILYRLLRVYYIMIFIRPAELKAYLMADLRHGPLNPERLKQFPVIFLAFILFFSSFTSMKIILSEIHHFAWDEFFMKADRAIHLGHDPWRLLFSVLGYPVITKIIAFVYILWFPGIFLVMYWQLFSLQDRQLRFRFFLTLVLTWGINGTFLATLFSSAGPCYYAHVAGSDYYMPLMDYLRAVDSKWELYAIKAQDFLWATYLSRGRVLAGGISAMPSIHVAVTFLFVLLGYNLGRPWFRVFLVWFLFILIGSVTLGWHYALDGYVSILTTAGLWWLSGKALSFHSRCRS